MPFFCIFDHPAMPLVRVAVEKRRRDHDKSDFRLRYVLEIPADGERHADDVIRMIDDAMGTRTKGHGVYQAKYEDVRGEYRKLMEAAGVTPDHPIHKFLRPLALLTAVAIGFCMALVVPTVVCTFLLVTAIKKQSGFAAMIEAEIVGQLFDWRPIIRKLVRYGLGGKR